MFWSLDRTPVFELALESFRMTELSSITCRFSLHYFARCKKLSYAIFFKCSILINYVYLYTETAKSVNEINTWKRNPFPEKYLSQVDFIHVHLFTYNSVSHLHFILNNHIPILTSCIRKCPINRRKITISWASSSYNLEAHIF